MTADLVAFLRARLDETAAKARAAGAELGGDWYYDDGHVLARREGDQVATGSQDYLEPERGEHIACHDPARVLADIEAKRGVLQLVTKAQEDAEFPDFLVSRPAKVMLLALEPVLQHLAMAHADHPDYRKEWRP